MIAVVLLYREVKKNGDYGVGLYTVDPRTGDRVSFPALSLAMLTDLAECDREP